MRFEDTSCCHDSFLNSQSPKKGTSTNSVHTPSPVRDPSLGLGHTQHRRGDYTDGR
ncbi:hypothetical protein AMATHDRAFT_71122 [Amanita thiersii Skay4041]|uniref:Uncharacterized protein n=1 Tax=Amanita thiersii Skay4041 TaxID=703135 RepID=A0A2A9NBX9_9AGAR|nr:hypothetical protein AMATHDRAFT_71122 [Amanita thiersii Skay4041]